ncbi:MAG TPA: hypothetical protein VJK30_04610 [Coxiellaceae bacterium]|nr:hypothetical protein [Coxiellaceae bacterium]
MCTLKMFLKVLTFGLIFITFTSYAGILINTSGAEPNALLYSCTGVSNGNAGGPHATSITAACSPAANQITVSSGSNSCTACISSGTLVSGNYPCGNASGTTFALSPSNSWSGAGGASSCPGGGGGGVNPPTGVSATGTGGSATVTWNAATGGTPPYTYTVTATPTPTQPLPTPTQTTTATLAGLTAASYKIVVNVTDSASIPDQNASAPYTFPNGGRQITVTNSTSNDPITVYMGILGYVLGPDDPVTHLPTHIPSLAFFNACFTLVSTPTCQFTTSNPIVCQFSLGKGQSGTINIVPITPTSANCTSLAATNNAPTSQASVAFSVSNLPWSNVPPTTLAEFTLNGVNSQDTIDISAVSGVNNLIQITGTSNKFNIDMSKATPGSYNGIAGIYPLGCDICSGSVGPPNPPGVQPKANCQGGTQYDPVPVCQIARTQITDNYTVTFTDVP